MILRGVVIVLLALSVVALPLAGGAWAQAKEIFVPSLVYRTGPYAPSGTPFANGMWDYLTMLNERDGGINGVKILFEEYETRYATDKGVECYERLKGKGPTGAAFFNPLSTGITFALTEKTLADKIPIITMGYGRADSKNGAVFMWNFPLLGTYWSAADIAIQHIAKEVGGADKLKGKKISLVYHDSPYGREPIPALQVLAKTEDCGALRGLVRPDALEDTRAVMEPVNTDVNGRVRPVDELAVHPDLRGLLHRAPS